MANSNNMTTTILAVVVSLAVAGAGGYMVGKRMGQPDAKAVATVNGEKITQTELYDEMVKQSGSQVLDRMISLKLVAQEAKKNNVAVTDAEIQAELTKVKESVGGEEAFQQVLTQQGMTEQQVKDSIVVQLQATKILSKDINTDDTELKKFFDENTTLFDQRKITARHILVATEEEAKAIKAQLDAGADFATLAKEKSTEPNAKESGGDLGTFGPGQMLPEFDAAAFAMKKGETSNPVKTQYGWHVIQVTNTQGEAPNFDTMKDEVKQKMIDQKVQEQFSEWLANLKDKASIDNTLAK